MKTRKKRAFTLVELMIVVGIICILASFAVPQYTRYREQAQRAKCISNLRAILEAKIAWRANNPNSAAAVNLDSLCSGGYFRGGTVGSNLVCPNGGTGYDIKYTDVNVPYIKPVCPNAETLEHALTNMKKEADK